MPTKEFILFRHACVLVTDLEKAIKFYKENFGFVQSHRQTLDGFYIEALWGNIPGIKLTYVKFHAKNQNKNEPPVLELHCWENAIGKPKGGFQHISFTVSNIDAIYKTLSNKGVKFLSPPLIAPDSGRKVCFCQDDDLNYIELVED